MKGPDAMRKTIAIIPTYNEADNILPLIRSVLSIAPELRVLVVDDDSPDGTWRIVEEEARRDERVLLLRRVKDRGRGHAGMEGFRRALDEGAEIVIEMDGDGSHDPAYIPALLKAVEEHDLVIGSRFLPGGADEERSWTRKLITRFARAYLCLVLGFRLSDPSSGFRCFRRNTLEGIEFESLRSLGPFIITETLFRCHRGGCRIGEIPIRFRERRKGRSKIHTGIFFLYCFQALKLRMDAAGRGNEA